MTWLLAQCRDLRHLALLSQVVHRNVQTSGNRFNIVISTRQFHLPVLASVVWEMRNQTFPSLLEREILDRLTAQCSQVLTTTTPLFSRQQEGVTLHNIAYQHSPEADSLHENIVRQEHLVCSHRREFLLPSVEILQNLRELSTNHLLPRSDQLTNLEKLSCLLSPGDDQHFRSFLRKLFRENTKNLKHLEVGDMSGENICVDLVLKEVVSAAPQLQTLVLADVAISARQNKILASLTQACSNLSQLQLTDIQSSDQRLFADLERALLVAKQLRQLQVHQKQLTQHCGRLLASLADNCDNIQQVVLIDPSRAFSLKKFPTENVIKLVQKDSMRFLYLCSELLTLNDVKSLKRSMKPLLVSKPYLLVKLQSTLAFSPSRYPGTRHEENLARMSPFYSLNDINDLPMELQRVVASSAGDCRDRFRNTSVAKVTVDNIF